MPTRPSSSRSRGVNGSRDARARRSRHRFWLTFGVVLALDAARVRGRRVVRVGAESSGWPRRPGVGADPLGLGRQGGGRRTPGARRDRIVARIPALVEGVGAARSRPGATRTSARTWASPTRTTRSPQDRPNASVDRAHGARVAARPPPRADRRPRRRAPRARPRRVPRPRAVGPDPFEVPGRPAVGRGLHLARHLLRRGSHRRADPADHRLGVRQARRRGEPRERRRRPGSPPSRPSSSRHWCRRRRAPRPTRPRSRR